jgi:Ala-tRNA(Pro) deacylase
MIPKMIDDYLHGHALRYAHCVHSRAIPAQRLAAAEHVAGERVAKVVVASVDDRLALAVVPAPRRVDFERLAEALDAGKAEMVPEPLFTSQFWPCEPGAEPPLSIFGVPIYVDAELAREPWLLMRAGTHEDAIQIDTDDWLLSERARIIQDLAAPVM